MQRNKLHILSTFIASVFYLTSFAQVNITLPASNIVARSNYSVQATTGFYTPIIGLIPVIAGRSNNGQFSNSTSSTTAALNVANFRLNSIGGVALLTSSQEAVLSTTYQTTYTSLASVLPGTVIMDYRIVTGAQTWCAGTYTTPFQLRTSPIGALSGAISPQIQDLNIIVPSFLQPQASIGPSVIHIDNLNYFRSGGANLNQSISFSTTLTYLLKLRTTASQFSFSSSTLYNSIPQANVSLAAAVLTNQTATTQVNLSSTNQELTPLGGAAVPTNNNVTHNVNFSISSANLKSAFVTAGTYSVPLIYTWSGSSLQSSVNSQFDVVIDDMYEIALSQPSVNIAFQNQTDVATGVVKQISGHITLSKTTPYDVYVKAQSANFTSGANQIPVSVVKIEPMSGQAGVSAVELSASPQLLISNADPQIDRQVNIQYRIPASKVPLLLGKPAGTYTTTVTYSFVAL